VHDAYKRLSVDVRYSYKYVGTSGQDTICWVPGGWGCSKSNRISDLLLTVAAGVSNDIKRNGTTTRCSVCSACIDHSNSMDTSDAIHTFKSHPPNTLHQERS